jgi:hypothetical protein
MARRPSRAAVDLTASPKRPVGRPRKPADAPEPDRGGKRAGTIRLPPEDWRRLRIMAAVRDTSMLEIVHLALTEWFERNQWPPKLL